MTWWEDNKACVSLFVLYVDKFSSDDRLYGKRTRSLGRRTGQKIDFADSWSVEAKKEKMSRYESPTAFHLCHN